MQLTTEQINAIHYWWCYRLHLDNYQEANINPRFREQLDRFSAHLYELLHINRYFLEINLKVHHGISLVVAEHDFQPGHSILANIFNLAIEKSTFPFCNFKTGTQMAIDETGNISVKIILPSNPERVYDANKILFWDNKTKQNLPIEAIPTREISFDPEKNIDLLMQQLMKSFDAYATQKPNGRL